MNEPKPTVSKARYEGSWMAEGERQKARRYLYVVLVIAFLITFIVFLSDSRYSIVQGGDGRYYVRNRCMWGLYEFTSAVGHPTLESARDARDNIYNPTNQAYKTIE